MVTVLPPLTAREDLAVARELSERGREATIEGSERGTPDVGEDEAPDAVARRGPRDGQDVQVTAVTVDTDTYFLFHHCSRDRDSGLCVALLVFTRLKNSICRSRRSASANVS